MWTTTNACWKAMVVGVAGVAVVVVGVVVGVAAAVGVIKMQMATTEEMVAAVGVAVLVGVVCI